jgi:pyridoxamine 5'-phosphate oxidase
MILATADASGRPHSRVVLLKGLEQGCFTFYTNYQSSKALQLATGHASLTFFWADLERQVHIRGPVEKVSAAQSDAYFAVRPYGSQIGAWASAQSQEIPGRAWLEQRTAELQAQYPEGAPVPRPAHWGGYAVTPQAMEFWQGRSSRLHDRICYEKNGSQWRIFRKSP